MASWAPDFAEGRLRLNKFSRNIRPHVHAELRSAREAEAQGQPSVAFRHLERAHILGLASTAEHVLVHWRMLLRGVRQRSARECLGQILRIVAAATMTAIGATPSGNTGGANVSPIKRMPVPPDLDVLIQSARRTSN